MSGLYSPSLDYNEGRGSREYALTAPTGWTTHNCFTAQKGTDRLTVAYLDAGHKFHAIERPSYCVG